MSEHDTSSNTFTEDGRLLQAEYAIKNVSKAGTIIGLVCSDGVVLFGINPSKTTTMEKIYKINNTTCCAVAGLFSDALRLVKHTRLTGANLYEELNEDPHLSVLCDNVAEEMQKYTHYGGARPFGVSFLYCGIEQGEYALFSTDPSGTVNRWKAWAFGSEEDAINSALRDGLKESLYTSDEGVIFLLKTLKKVRECTNDIADKLEILIYSKENQKILGLEKIKQLIASI